LTGMSGFAGLGGVSADIDTLDGRGWEDTGISFHPAGKPKSEAAAATGADTIIVGTDNIDLGSEFARKMGYPQPAAVKKGSPKKRKKKKHKNSKTAAVQ